MSRSRGHTDIPKLIWFNFQLRLQDTKDLQGLQVFDFGSNRSLWKRRVENRCFQQRRAFLKLSFGSNLSRKMIPERMLSVCQQTFETNEQADLVTDTETATCDYNLPKTFTRTKHLQGLGLVAWSCNAGHGGQVQRMVRSYGFLSLYR